MEERSKLALKNYLALISPDAARCIRVAQHQRLKTAECFLLYYWNSQIGCRIPYYISMPELNRIEGEYAHLYGRTPWGVWCILTLLNFKIIKVRRVLYPESNERIKFLEEYFNDFEVK